MCLQSVEGEYHEKAVELLKIAHGKYKVVIICHLLSRLMQCYHALDKLRVAKSPSADLLPQYFSKWCWLRCHFTAKLRYLYHSHETYSILCHQVFIPSLIQTLSSPPLLLVFTQCLLHHRICSRYESWLLFGIPILMVRLRWCGLLSECLGGRVGINSWLTLASWWPWHEQSRH